MRSDALLLLGALQNEGLKPFDELSLHLRGLRDILTALWACWLGRIVPVSRAEGLERPGRTGAVLTDEDAKNEGEPLGSSRILRYGSLPPFNGKIQRMRDGDRALLQHTSGSTGIPRRVVLTGANLREGALASSIVVRAGLAERYLSWLPLSHIFGLVGCHLVPLFNGFDQFLMDPGLFLKDPSVWLRTCGKWGCTVTASSLFGLELALRSARSGEMGMNLDLSSVNVCLCGGETLRPATLLDFEDKMSRFGWRKGALCPAYGLSEATMGVSCKPPGEPMSVDRIDPKSVSIGRRLRFLDEPDNTGDAETPCGEKALERVSLGILDSCNDAAVRAIDGETLPDEHLGIVHLRGSNVCAGYDPPGAQNPDADGWLDTGDLGYFRLGRLTIFARHKEMICHNGLNHSLRDMEESAAGETGAEFSIAETPNGLFIAGNETDADTLDAAALHIQDEWVVPIAGIVTLPSLPRTAKGAIDRLSISVALESGRHKSRPPAARCASASKLSPIARRMAAVWRRVLLAQHAPDTSDKPDEPNSPNPEKITLSGESRFAELGGDSLSLFDLAVAIEEEFGVPVETSDLRDAPNLSAAAQLVERLIGR
jgi:acyl-CoA synthetase (AMP-forming)/AMP-acid ligase II